MSNVSVIMAAHNPGAYLVPAIESILSQTYRDFDLVIIDDGSSDGSARRLQAFARRDPRIRILRHYTQNGLTRSLNECLKHVSGRYIARMDADDVSVRDRFEHQVRYLDSHPQCVCVGAQIVLTDPYGSEIEWPRHELEHEAIDQQLLAGIGWAVVHGVSMMRAEALREVGGYREQFITSQDLDLFLRLAEIGRMANLPESLYRFRRHFHSISYRQHELQWNLTATIVADAYKRRGLRLPEQWHFKRRNVLPQAEQTAQWAWWALKQGNVAVARRHATHLLARRPLSLDSWRVMYCALRGR